MAAVWATSSLYQHTSIGDRHNLLVRWRLLFHQYQYSDTTDSRSIHHRQSTDTPATVDRNIPTVVSAECWPTYQPIVWTDSLLTWTTCRPTLGRHIDRVSVDISAETRPTNRPRVSTYTRSTDALSTHDPTIQGVNASNFKIGQTWSARLIWNCEHYYSVNCTTQGPITN